MNRKDRNRILAWLLLVMVLPAPFVLFSTTSASLLGTTGIRFSASTALASRFLLLGATGTRFSASAG